MKHRLCMKALCLAAIGPLLPESTFSERDMDNTRNVFSDSEEFFPHTCLRFEFFVSNYR
jgi:hypothetical protein